MSAASPIQRHFLDWSVPLTDAIATWLLPGPIREAVDLDDTLIIVPTREAGRRLREALARRCAAAGTALLSAQTLTPATLARTRPDPAAAGPLLTGAVWLEVLTSLDRGNYAALLPGENGTPDSGRLMGVARLLQKLRKELAAEDMGIADVAQRTDVVADEAGRWDDLARLEAAYLARLAELGLRDDCELERESARDPEVPTSVKRIVVAAVPAPTPLMVRAVESLAARLEVHVLVHAPEAMAPGFDLWGRPLPAWWESRRIDLPDPEANILAAASPEGQARTVLSLMAEESARFAPGDLALGVPDRAVIPFVESALAAHGIAVFDPADTSMGLHPLYRLLAQTLALVRDGRYRAFADWLRNPDVLLHLEAAHGVNPARALTDLDLFQNQHLPADWRDVASRFTDGGAYRGACRDSDMSALASAVKAASGIRRMLEGEAVADGVREALRTLLTHRMLQPELDDDAAFAAVAEAIMDALDDMTGTVFRRIRLQAPDRMTLLLELVAARGYPSARPPRAIDLEGWLELPWNEAPFLVVTGMNEGTVPDSRPSDVFLPDAARRALGLPSDADRLARDAYVLSELAAARARDGRLCLIAGRMSADGDPLKPSRLLFRCDDAELIARTRRLFEAPAPAADPPPYAVSFRLDPTAPLARSNDAAHRRFALHEDGEQDRASLEGAAAPSHIPPDAARVTAMRVTEFRDYLASPFHYYLRRVVGMEPCDDSKIQLDGAEFGTLVHAALRAMGENARMLRCTDAAQLGDFLCEALDRAARAQYGADPVLAILVNLETMRQRLRHAAAAQVRLVEEGWDTVATERPFTLTISGMPLRGTIDRIDRHRETGEFRLIDYKTSDAGTTPEKAHLAAVRDDTPDYARFRDPESERVRRWVDLQLPLYRLLAAEVTGKAAAGLAYFVLPKAVTDTGLLCWDGYSEAVQESALRCAQGVIASVQARRFWPPGRVDARYDDFATLYPDGDVVSAFDGAALERLVAGSERKGAPP